jgi:hypothetical protein
MVKYLRIKIYWFLSFGFVRAGGRACYAHNTQYYSIVEGKIQGLDKKILYKLERKERIFFEQSAKLRNGIDIAGNVVYNVRDYK